ITSYTWSKAIDDNDGISAAANADSTFAQDFRNLGPERGLSSYDVTHRLVASLVWDLPFGSDRYVAISNPVVKALAGGWQLTSILTLQGGRPFTVLSGRDESDTGGGADRPNSIGDWRVPNRTPDRWFNPCPLLADGVTRRNCRPDDKPAWQINAIRTFGSAGRNILRTDQLKNFDFGVYRMFPITERHSIRFRAEFFNLPNHPNFLLPTMSAASSAFGTISRASSQSDTGSQRQIQFALKYVF